MLSIFRTNQFSVSILLIFYAVALHLSGFFIDHGWNAVESGLLYDGLFAWLDPTSALSKIIAIAILFLNALLINSLDLNNRMGREFTQFPGLFYILISSLLPDFLHLSPLHIANTFYIIAIFQLFDIYKKHQPTVKIFNAGFWIATGSLFYFSYVIFVIWAVVALSKLRSIKIREIFMVIVSFLVPYFLTGAWMYWRGTFSEFISRLQGVGIHLPKVLIFQSTEGIIKFILFALILAIVILSQNSYMYKAKIEVRKKINLLYWGIGIVLISFFLSATNVTEQLLIFTVPVGILLGLGFSFLQKNVGEFFHFLLFAAAIIWQLKSIFGL